MFRFVAHLFDNYMKEMVLKWNQIYTKVITLSIGIKINILFFFADDRVLIADSVDN